MTISRDFVEALPDLLRRLGTRVLGFEPGFVSWDLHSRVSKAFKGLRPGVRLQPIKGLVEKLREIKAPEEIQAMERASDLMGAVLDQVIPPCDPGERKRMWHGRSRGWPGKGGAEGMAFESIVASGPNGALPHAVPSIGNSGPGSPWSWMWACALTGTVAT